jgi:hypothetical protein
LSAISQARLQFRFPKQAFVLAGRQSGANVTELAEIRRIGTSNVSRRFDAARERLVTDLEFQASHNKVNVQYYANKARKQA